MTPTLRRMLVGLAALALVSIPRAALACPVCFGNSDAPMAKAVNAGVVFMLVIVVAVLGGFASFIVHLARRARLASEPQPIEAADMATYGLSGGTPTEGTV
jgi:hypothetical protein